MDDRMPPQDLDAERCLLSLCMWGPQGIEESRSRVSPSSFYLSSHKLIFQTICDLTDNGEKVDASTIISDLRAKKCLDSVGGAVSILDLSASYMVPDGAEFMARRVRGADIRRSLQSHHARQRDRAYDMSIPVEDLVKDAACDLDTESRNDDVWEESGKVVEGSHAGFVKSMALGGQISGLPTGILDLDDLLNGLQPSESIIIAARPSQGKTAMGLQVAMEASKKVPVGFVSIEMPNKSLVDRLVCQTAGIDSQDFRRGRLTPGQVEEVRRAYGTVARSPIFFSDSLRDIGRIELEARRMKREYNVGLLVVDYLQLCDAPKTANRDRNREQAVSEVSRTLKAVAKAASIPVVTLAQLNRESEKRKDKRPTLADLRESGSIEQDADVVMLLHRPEKSGPPVQGGESVVGLMEINVAKQRNGPTGVVRSHFSDKNGRFTSWV